MWGRGKCWERWWCTERSKELLQDGFKTPSHKANEWLKIHQHVAQKTNTDLPFRPFCFKVFADSWIVLPWPMFSGNFRSSRFPSVLSLATSNSVHNIEVSLFCEKSAKLQEFPSPLNSFWFLMLDMFNLYESLWLVFSFDWQNKMSKDAQKPHKNFKCTIIKLNP